MGRLIDADAFAEKIKEISIRQGYYDFYPKSMSVGEILDSVIADLKGEGVCGFENAPTADAVPVVRCKNCKYRTDGKCFFTGKAKDPDDCCSFGEKVTKHGMKKFFVLSRCGPEYHRIVEADDISEVADRYHDSCYGIVEILQDEVNE